MTESSVTSVYTKRLYMKSHHIRLYKMSCNFFRRLQEHDELQPPVHPVPQLPLQLEEQPPKHPPLHPV